MLATVRSRTVASRPTRYWRLNSQNAAQNQAVVDFLKRCQQDEEAQEKPNGFKVRAYGNAIQTVSKVSQPIKLGTDVAKLPGIGSSMATKISEFLYASENSDKRDPKLEQEIASAKAARILETVPGIGPTSARKLAAAGCRSLADLKLPIFMSMLSKKQQAKVKFMGHIEKPADRADAKDALTFCRDNLDKRYELTLAGDYRRGSSSFPEICVVVAHPDHVHIPVPSVVPDSEFGTADEPKATRKRKTRETKKTKEASLLVSDFIPVLERRGLIAETLDETSNSWKGIVRLPDERGKWGDLASRKAGLLSMDGKFRRMIIHFVPYQSRGAALMHLTGDSEFLAHLGHLAKRTGMLLNEYGLWDWKDPISSYPVSLAGSWLEQIEVNEEVAPEDASEDRAKGYWALIASEREEDIFEELGTDFVDPAKRNFSFVSDKGKRKTRRKRATLGFLVP